MSGEVRNVKVRLSVDNAQAIAGMSQFGAAANQTSQQVTKAGAAAQANWDKIGRGATKVALVGAAGLAVMQRSVMGFDKEMSAVDAATHETAKNMGLLREAAISAGADTSFSASEAAQGITELAKAGVSTKDVLGGGLKGALDLAAAGQISVAEASETAASAMTQFGLDGSKVPHIADLLAAGAGKAQGSVSDMGQALNQAGLVAAQTGLSIEETTGTLAAFASAGLVGSDAGTSFKTMLMSLNPRSKEAAALMKEHNIEAYNAQGNFIGMEKYAGKLREGLKGMSAEQRNATLKTIFGSDAVRAASLLYRNGAKGIEDWTKKVNDSGHAADAADKLTDNLAGDMERLGGALESAFIKGGSGSQKGLRDMAQGAENLVERFSKLPASVQENVVKTVAALTGLAGGVAIVSKAMTIKSALGLGKGAAGVAGAVGKGVQPVIVTNWPPGFGKGGPGVVPGGPGNKVPPVVATPTKPSRVPRGLSNSTKLVGSSLATGAAALNMKAFAGILGGGILNGLIQNKLSKVGDRGPESGPMSMFRKPKTGAMVGDRSATAMMWGEGNTFRKAAQATSRAKTAPFGGAGAKLEEGLGRLPGLSVMSRLPEQIDAVKKYDKALAKLNSSNPAKGTAEFDNAVRKSGLSTKELNQILPSTAKAMEKNRESSQAYTASMGENMDRARAAGLTVAEYGKKVATLPKEVQTKITAPGAKPTLSEV